SKMATTASGSAGNNHDPGLFTASAQAEPAQLDKVRDLLIQTVEGMAATPFTADEVEKARVRSTRMLERRHATSSVMAQAVSSASALGDWRLLFIQRDRLAAVTADDVNRVARTYFQKPNRTVGIFIPEDRPQRLAIPAVASLDAIVKDYKGGKVEAGG